MQIKTSVIILKIFDALSENNLTTLPKSRGYTGSILSENKIKFISFLKIKYSIKLTVGPLIKTIHSFKKAMQPNALFREAPKKATAKAFV